MTPAVAYLFLVRSMHAWSLFVAIALITPLQCVFAQSRVVIDARLPADSIELKPHYPPATSTPWQLPKPGDPLFDAEKEAQIKKEDEAGVKGNSHLVHTFERGVFKGYNTLSRIRSNVLPTAKDVFHLQSECVEIGKKVLDGNLPYQMEQEDLKNGRAPRYDVTQLAHYNAKDNHCYVELTTRDTDIKTGELKQSVRKVYDGQTGELLASCWIKNPPFGRAFGVIFKFQRVPESALPAQPDFSKEHEEDWSKNQADRTNAFIDYLMEGE